MNKLNNDLARCSWNLAADVFNAYNDSFKLISCRVGLYQEKDQEANAPFPKLSKTQSQHTSPDY
jgi:hypothetical protein